MGSFFNNVTDYKPHTWIVVDSTMHVFLEIFQKSYFSEYFGTAVSTNYPEKFSHIFARYRAFLAVFAFHFGVVIYLSLYLCVILTLTF